MDMLQSTWSKTPLAQEMRFSLDFSRRVDLVARLCPRRWPGAVPPCHLHLPPFHRQPMQTELR